MQDFKQQQQQSTGETRGTKVQKGVRFAEGETDAPSSLAKGTNKEQFTTAHNNEKDDDALDIRDGSVLELPTLSSSLSPSSSSLVWSGTKNGWDLTWGIWHNLPHTERKQIAISHGYKSIGEFEEYVSLQQAVDVSEYSMAVEVKDPEENYGKNEVNANTQKQHQEQQEQTYGEGYEDEGEDDVTIVCSSFENESGNEMIEFDRPVLLSGNELIKAGGQILILPSELLHRVFSWLPVDMYGVLAFVSPHWKFLTRTENVYKRLCERLYLNQSKRRQLNVSKFRNSYRRMLELRPRVRAAGGAYVLKYTKIKTIERDMWCEIPVGAILKSEYYRYLYFYEDGRVLYALTPQPPKIMFRKILTAVLSRGIGEFNDGLMNNNSNNSNNNSITKKGAPVIDKSIVFGRFQIQKNKCTVIAKQPWQLVRFDITIVSNSPFGKFAALTMDRHRTSVNGKDSCFNFDSEKDCDSNQFWTSSSHDIVEHECPEKQFQFIKDPRL